MQAQFIQTLQEYKSDYETAKQLGTAMLACNAMLVPEIAPNIALLFKTYPRPIVTNNEGADIAFAGGLQGHVAGVPKTSFEGSVTMIETETGQAADFAELLITRGGMTNCILYDGRINRWTKAHELIDCAFTFEPAELDSESRSSILTISANMKYMYFGQNAKVGTASNATFGGTQVPVHGGSGGASSFLNKAQNLLNVVTAGNSLFSAAKSIF
ncbi:hypothetical protein [Acinetobacter pittii]|uniref:hypothetical protein n=1 Tax=Acinetobacter pittii TaxID=48296 RepID=UPI001580FD98|nr:hypothetical protein [Acinetobacter pittii]NUF43094.1 hypothetical protein [Acinetobacter pittii]